MYSILLPTVKKKKQYTLKKVFLHLVVQDTKFCTARDTLNKSSYEWYLRRRIPTQSSAGQSGEANHFLKTKVY